MTYSLSTTSGNGDPDSPTFRVLLYSRVSSLHQVQTGHSLDAQPEALSAWAESVGPVPKGIEFDVGNFKPAG